VKFRRLACIALLMLLLLATACTEQEDGGQLPAPFYTQGMDPATLPLQVTEDRFQDPPYGSITRRIGFAGQDLTGHNFSLVRAAILAGYSFDSHTRWPGGAALPEGFDPWAWLEAARDPGLGIRYLRSQGYNGEGLAVAVLSGDVLREHVEFSPDTRFYPEQATPGPSADMAYQGMVATSLLAGRTCGVAPAARLHYFTVPGGADVFLRYSETIGEIVEMNQDLPAGEQIRLVVIVDGLSPEDDDWVLWEESLVAAETAGLSVLYANNAAEKGFFWGGCPPYKDRDQAGNYEPAGILKGGAMEEGGVLVPGDYRTTALHTGPEVYMYWADGGFSWAVPYLGGLCLMAWQTAPELSLDQLLDIMKETADVTAFDWKVLNPVRFIFAVESAHSP
jgi:serine protease AprX